MWRIIFSKYKLKKEQCVYLQALFDKYMYSCGASLKDLELPEEYSTVEIRDHDCYDPIEKLYYSAKNDPICCIVQRTSHIRLRSTTLYVVTVSLRVKLLY